MDTPVAPPLLPEAKDAPGGGGKLTTSYYVNDLIHSQTQDGITNTYELDAALRERERIRTGDSEEGTGIYHFSNESWIRIA